LLRGHGSQSLQIFTSGRGSWCVTLPHWDPPPNFFWGGGIFTPLGLEGMAAWSRLFLTIGPEKEYPKLVLKFWGLPQNMQEGVKVSPNFVIFWLFCPFLHNGAIYHQSENGLSNYGHSHMRWWKSGVLWSTMNYVIVAYSHPLCNLLSSLFTKRLARWCHMGGGIPTW